MTWFGRDRWELGPSFRCVLCVRPEKDTDRDCPRCELSQLYASYQDAIKAETERYSGGFTVDWPQWKILGLYNQVCDLLASNRNRVDRNWHVTLIKFASIVVEEREQARYEVAWESWKKSRDKK